MSAKIVKLPERIYRPNLHEAFEIIDDQEGDMGKLLAVARMALNGIEAHRGRRDTSPKAMQGVTNGMMIAALALLTVLGVPRNEMERL